MKKYSMARYFQKRQAFTPGGRNKRSAREALRLRPLGVEQLEPRLSPAANLTITNVSYYNTNAQPVTSINAGQLIYVVASFTTTDLPGNASYRVAYTVNGFTQYSGQLTYGAGLSGTNSWYEYWGYFDTTPGTNQVSVTVDPDHSVAESTYADNTINTTFTGSQTTVGYFSYSVAQIRAAYGLNSIPNFGSATPDGSGQTIALIEAGNDPSILSDLDGFDQGMSLTTTSSESLYQQYGPASSFATVYNQYGRNITADIGTSGANGVPTADPTGGWEGEETLDVEWAHAIAPGAKIDIIETNFNETLDNGLLNDPDLMTGNQLAASLPGVSVVSNSWGIDEFSGQTAYDSSTFVTPNGHTGVTFLAGSGDGGAHSYGGIPSVTDADSFYPASSPNVVSVGASQLTLDNNAYAGESGWSYGTPRTLNNGSASYTQSGSWATQPGGFSGTYSTAAGGTNSSAVWTTTLTGSDYGWSNAVEVSATWTPNAANATNATYTIYDGTQASGTVIGVIPVNQTLAPNGTADGNSQFQELGNFYPTSGTITVVLNAGSANGTVDADAVGIAAAWATSGGPSQYESEPSYQEAFQSTGLRTTPDVSFDGSGNSGVTCYQYGGWYFDYAGTSLATPCWAGLIAIANQGRVAENGTTLNSAANPQQALEAIYSLPASDFNQITTGYNGFNAGPGYNYIAGRGSPIANVLIPDLVSYGITLNNGVLTVTANSDSSTISLTLSDSGGVDVTLDGRQQDFGPGLVTSIVVDGLGGSDSLTVDDAGTASAQTYTLAAGSIDRSGAPPITYSNVPNVTLDAGNFGDTVNWLGTAAGTTTTVDAGAGVNTINYGDTSNTLDGFQGAAILVGQGSNNTIVVNDQGSTVAHTYGVSGSAVTRDTTGFNLSYSDVQNLTFNAGSGGNRINFSGTAYGETTTVNAGTGGDLIYASDFADPYNLYTLNDFLGTSRINGAADNTTVDVIDGGPDFTYDITATSVTRTGGVAIVSAPPTVSFSYSGLQTLALVDGGGNTFDWQGTAAGTTTILNEVGPNDTINLGDADNTLDGFQSDPIIAGYGDLSDTLNIDDQGSTAAHDYTIANGVSIPFTYYFNIPADNQDRTPPASYTVVGSSFTRDGLTLFYSGLDAVNFNAGSGNNNIDWQGNSGDGIGTLPSDFLTYFGFPAPLPYVATTVYTGTGQNTITLGNGSHTLDNFGGTAVLVGQGSNNSVAFDDSGSTTPHTYTLAGGTLSRDGFTFDYGDIQSLTLLGGSGGNTVDWQGDEPGITDTVYGGTGANTVNFGDANGTLDGFNGTPIFQGQGSNNTVNVFDQGTTTARNYVLTGTALSPDGGAGFGYGYDEQVTNIYLGSGGNTLDWRGTAAGDITTVYTGTGTNTINYGDADNTLDSFDGTPILQGQGTNNTVNVYDQGSTAPHTYVITGDSLSRDGGTGYGYDLQAVNYYFGSGGNTIDWQGDATGETDTVYTGTGANVINYGDANNTLDGFLGTPILQGQGSNNTVNVYDQGSTAPHTYVITPNSLSRDGGTGYGYGTGFVAVNYYFGSGGNTIDWQGDGAPTTVHTGTGTNTINFGDANNTLLSFADNITLDGQGGNNTVNVYDQGDTSPRTATFGISSTGASTLSQPGVAGFSSAYNVQSLNYYLGSGGNTINWQGVASGQTMTVYTGTGDNTINFGDANNTLDSFQGTPILQGQGSNNTINVYDQGSTAAHNYVVTPTSFSRDGGSGYGYDIQNANFFFGTGANTLDWQGNAAGTVYTATFPGGSDQISGNYSTAATAINGAVSLNGATAGFGTLTVGSQGSLNLSQAASGTITASSINDQGSITGSGQLALADSGNFTSGNLNLVLGGTTAGTNYDQVQVGGTATLTGTLSLSLVSGFVPTPGSTFTIIEDTAGTPVSGTFTGLPNGTLIHVSGVDGSNQPFTAIFEINYEGGDVVLTDVAEPQVSASNASVTVTVGATATNSGTWSQPGFSGTETITASVGTITRAGSNGSGTWSWSYPVTMTSQAQTVTISASDGQGDTGTTTFSLVVNPDPTTTTVQSSVNPSYHGQSVTFTATVTPANSDPVPTGGTVTFLDGTTVLGSGALSGDVATFTTSALATGGHSITASYGGDANYAGSTSGALTQTVKAFASTTSVTSSVNPSVFGQKVTFTATVKAVSGSTVPTGTVTFLDGTTTLGTATLNTSGKATFSTTALAVGSHSITVSYGGDGNFTGSTSSILTQNVNQASSSSRVISSSNPAVYGQTITFTATIAAVSPGAGTPTGTVTFIDGTTTLGTGTLSGGKATFSTNALTVGSHSITVNYGGDGNFTGSTSAALAQTINPDSTTGKVTSSANPSVFGQSVTFTATVSAKSPGSGTPAGSVTFMDGSSVLATVPLTAGSATYTTSTLSVASHTITFQFTPSDGNFTGSTSASLTQVVHQSYTSTTLTSSLNPSTFGTSVTFTAVVTATAPGTGIPTGSVTFKDGSKTLMVVPLDPTGTATYTISTLSVGNHTISATYGGSTNYRNANPASLTQVVTAAGNNQAVVFGLTAQEFAATSFGAANARSAVTGGPTSTNSGSLAFFTTGASAQQGLASESIAASQNGKSGATQISALDQFFASFGNGGSDLTDPEDKS